MFLHTRERIKDISSDIRNFDILSIKFSCSVQRKSRMSAESCSINSG
jgi:hypothetical protein